MDFFEQSLVWSRVKIERNTILAVDRDDRLHKRLERESLWFCSVPNGWRHCRALKNITGWGAQLSQFVLRDADTGPRDQRDSGACPNWSTLMFNYILVSVVWLCVSFFFFFFFFFEDFLQLTRLFWKWRKSIAVMKNGDSTTSVRKLFIPREISISLSR